MPKRKYVLPFEKRNGDIIWTISDGEKIKLSWEEFKELVKSKEYVALPRREFEEWYKRMRCPKAVREYHFNKSKESSSNRRGRA